MNDEIIRQSLDPFCKKSRQGKKFQMLNPKGDDLKLFWEEKRRGEGVFG